MRIADSLVEKLLRKSGKLSKDQLSALKEHESAEKKPLQDLVITEHLLTEEEFTRLYADEIEVPFIELTGTESKLELLKLLPERIARQYNSIIFALDKAGVPQVAMTDPDDVQAIDFLQKQLGRRPVVYLTTNSLLQAALSQYRATNTAELSNVIASKDDVVDEDDGPESPAVAQTVTLIIENAIAAGASDIHIEPHERLVVIRYRIDGLLRETNKLPRKMLESLVGHIKHLSTLAVTEHRLPQDGRFKIEVSGLVYVLRVSTLPILDGEKVVIRILNESNNAPNFKELGFWGNALSELNHAIVQPHGMVLVSGPTGSGKSTTLVSVLSQLSSPSINVSTIEDPVEYRIVGANQTQVNLVAGMTLKSGLRALLRQDPNIIMVEEIRDRETTDLVVQAALSGHLMFSTVHTNNAAGCIPRLIDMGIESFLIASTLRAVIGQRLVRRLCLVCRESFEPDATMIGQLVKTLHLSEQGGFAEMNNLESAALNDGIGAANNQDEAQLNHLSSTPSGIRRLWRAHDDGCDACNHTGFKGRLGIYEVLLNTPAMQTQIISSASGKEIEATAVKKGMLTMQLDGFIKALRGQTTIEEITRATTTL
jgi:type IV pilus assembly protein PilB